MKIEHYLKELKEKKQIVRNEMGNVDSAVADMLGDITEAGIKYRKGVNPTTVYRSSAYTELSHAMVVIDRYSSNGVAGTQTPDALKVLLKKCSDAVRVYFDKVKASEEYAKGQIKTAIEQKKRRAEKLKKKEQAGKNEKP